MIFPRPENELPFLSGFRAVPRGLCVIACGGFALAACAFGDGLAVADADGRLTVSEGDRPVLVFNYQEVRPSDDEGVARSGYVHPLYDPEGVPLTDDFPADHPHHRGVFLAWPRVEVLGSQVDPWHLRGARPVFEELVPREAGSAAAAFEASHLWVLDDGTEAMRQHLRYTVHAADETGRAIDLHATVTNLTGEPIVLRGQTGALYGGLNIRMDGERPDVVITTAEGRLDGDANYIDPPSPWASHASRSAAEGPHTGVAIFQHPENPDYPARHWTLRRYGFLGAAWPGESSYEIDSGASLDLRYRLFVHRGTADEAGVAGRFDAYRSESGR